jgi:hypothetical protein
MSTTEPPQPDEAATPKTKDPAGTSLPVLMLTFLGTLIVVLGLFAAGDAGLVIVGLAALTVAGLIQVFGSGR